MFEREKRKNLSLHNKINDSIYVSRFEGLNLVEYISTCCFVCNARHQQPCEVCDGKVKVARHIVEHGFIKLNTAFTMSNPNVSYSAKDARRKFLQMPLAAIGVGDQKKGTYCLYLVEKKSHTSYTVFQSLLNKAIIRDSKQHVTREEVTQLLYLAESESEREHLKYAIVKSTGLSSTEAKKLYGFGDMNKRIQQVEDAAQTAQDIMESIDKLAHLKEKGLLDAFGIPLSSESESSESETDQELTEEGTYLPDSESPKSVNDFTVSIDNEEVLQDRSECSGLSKNTSGDELQSNPSQLLNILRISDFNWFEFMNVARESVKELSECAFEERILGFYRTLPFTGMSDSEMNTVQQSRQVYILKKSQQDREYDIETGNIVSESDESNSDGDIRKIQSPFDASGQFLIKKRRDAIRRKATRDAKRKIAEQRLLKRRKSKKVSKILQDCPDIGKTIEDFVQKCGAGADAWRRTGVITFDGNKKLEKRATFKRVKEHLEEKYKRKISYGTVVQLCIARNKRSRSSLRYRGVAKVLQKRARKGFNIKYNPDSHWSNALYSGLDALQYRDGTKIVNLGRDDQAGFRLDTVATHRLHGTLCVKGKESLATRTDYVNKYPSTLQTTCYNFPGTETTGEICMGVVKAPVLFNKNSAQHLADLEAISNNEYSNAAFVNQTTGKRKEIECIRVDGGYDEGPTHLETQYWWTLHHLKTGSHALLVTSRNGGASFRNRVELQNGCLALAHSNLFIPSTLNGSCTLEGGNVVNEEVLKRNLESAIDLYISRVDGAPCASTQIRLIKGADSKAYQEENELLKIFLKGKKEQKEEMKRNHPAMHSKFQQIWQLREKHLHKDLPAKYVFYLTCCYENTCLHETCKKGKPEKELTWYPNGPLISFFPIPKPDPKRPFGCTSCTQCKNTCSGHYLKPPALFELSEKSKPVPVSNSEPPSNVILAVFNDYKVVPPSEVIQDTARKVLLSVDETRMWFQHLSQTAANRAKGAKKAAETRRKKKDHGNNSATTSLPRQTTENTDDICLICKMPDPPLSDGPGNDVDHLVAWISCDGCTLWCHMGCADISSGEVPSQWLCGNCREIW